MYAAVNVILCSHVGTDAHPDNRFAFPLASAAPAHAAVLNRLKHAERVFVIFPSNHELIEAGRVYDGNTGLQTAQSLRGSRNDEAFQGHQPRPFRHSGAVH